jgi:hypothetical protein
MAEKVNPSIESRGKDAENLPEANVSKPFAEPLNPVNSDEENETPPNLFLAK